jgi:hypothetical protein
VAFPDDARIIGVTVPYDGSGDKSFNLSAVDGGWSVSALGRPEIDDAVFPTFDDAYQAGRAAVAAMLDAESGLHTDLAALHP